MRTRFKSLIHDSGFERQADLAEVTGIHQSTISRIVRGRKSPTTAQKEILSRSLDGRKLTQALRDPQTEERQKI